MKDISVILFVLAIFAVACTKSSKDNDGQWTIEESVTEIIATVDDLVPADQTKTTFNPSTDMFTWVAKDQVGFWSDPTADNQLGNPVQVIFDVEKVVGDETYFRGNGFGILRNKTYHTYYPYNDSALYNNVHISYKDQKPLTTGGTSHLGAYDFVYSTAVTPATDKVAFVYHHLGCLSEFNVTLSGTEVQNPTKFTLTSASNIFVQQADYNPSLPTSESVPELVNKTMTNTLDFNLGSGSGLVRDGNNTVKIYAMMSPVSWAGVGVSAKVVDAGGMNYQCDFTPAQSQTAGTHYTYNITVAEVKEEEDLSDGETANCYIVSNPGYYKFEAKKGYNGDPVSGINGVEIYWESNGTTTAPTQENPIISGVSYTNDGYVHFRKPNDTKGNALIVAKNSNSTILWSWHIWCTDKPKDEVYRCSAGTLMDRNLGALSKEGNTSTGLFYQWGRKDPFMGNASIASNTSIAARCTTNVSFGSVACSTAGSTNSAVINYAVQHPTTFIQGASNDWLPQGQADTDGLWWEYGVDKTNDDPCPPGYKVAEGSRDNSTDAGKGFYGKAFNTYYILNNWSTDHWSVSGTSYASYNITLSNNVMSVPLENGGSALYPVAGYLSESYARNGNNILIWTNYHQSAGGAASTAWTAIHSGCLDINTNNHEIKVNWTSGRAAGKPVRCQKIPK